MRPAEISDSAIIEAGRALLRNGKPVTGARLRTAIKGGNPARLFKVWESLRDSAGETPEVGIAARTYEPMHSLAEARIAEISNSLESAQAELLRERQKTEQAQLLLDAVTDEMLKLKERCAALEAKDLQQRDRIADLTARVQEQSASLNRGEQSRMALQRALEMITASSQ